ncbi:MAG TPA: histidine phosphatase family protein [Patescibacteria group bacterium]|nr:histidine phosphatase family protein [Patescibacteria group bacterium]
MKPTLYLMRHGQDEDNKRHILNGHRDTHLTFLGRKQAEEAATVLKDAKITFILSSPLQRAVETATIISRILRVKVEIIGGLIERDYGVLTGIPSKDKEKYAKEIHIIHESHYFLGVEGAEEFLAVYLRARHVLQELTVTLENNKCLLVSHGDFLQMMRAAYYEKTWEEGLAFRYLKNGEVLALTQNGETSLPEGKNV